MREIAFPTGNTYAERKTAFQAELLRVEPEPGGLAYLLIVASFHELPMGGWRFEDVDDFYFSDLPYLTRADLTGDEPLPRQTIEDGARSRFVPGRLLFTSEADLRTTVRSMKAFESRLEGRPEPFALLGAERFAIRNDTSLVMHRAGQIMRRRGWQTELWAVDRPFDRDLGSSPWLGRWAESGPVVAYAIAHGDARHLGAHLIPARSLPLPAEPGEGAPARPSVFLTFGCSLGDPLAYGGPGSRPTILHELFSKGWIAAAVCSTEVTGPSPLPTGVGSELNVGRGITSGLPLGLVVRAVRERYLEQSRKMPSYHLSAEVRESYLRNLAGITLYGDPSLRLPEAR